MEETGGPGKNHRSTIGYHRNYSGRWLDASMSDSKSTSLMRDFTSLPELDLMFMFAVQSYLHSWCFQCSSRPISNCLTVFAWITDSRRLFHISTILTTKVYFLTFSLLVLSSSSCYVPLYLKLCLAQTYPLIINTIYYFKYFNHISWHSSILQSGHLEFLQSFVIFHVV